MKFTDEGGEMNTLLWILDRLIEVAAMLGVVAVFGLIALAYGA